MQLDIEISCVGSQGRSLAKIMRLIDKHFLRRTKTVESKNIKMFTTVEDMSLHSVEILHLELRLVWFIGRLARCLEMLRISIGWLHSHHN
jgi:hypothetical protein